MELNNRITLYVAVLVVFAMIILPCANAQPSGRGGRGGMMGGDNMPGSRSGGMMGGDSMPGPRGERDSGRGGRPGGRGMPFSQDEVLTESQVDRVLQEFSRRDPETAKELKELRKTDKDKFDSALKDKAFYEILRVTSTDREYNGYLEWCEKFVSDEAAGIKELKEENFELYKERLGKLEEKYRSLIHSHMPDELMKISVRDLQLNLKHTELSMQYSRRGTTQEQKEKILSELEAVWSEQYDQTIKRMNYEFQQIEVRIKSLQDSLAQQKSHAKELGDPEVKVQEMNNLKEFFIRSQSSRRGFGLRGMFGGNRFPTSSIPDMNSYPFPY